MIGSAENSTKSLHEKDLLQPNSSKKEGDAELFGSQAANTSNTTTSRQLQMQHLLQQFEKKLTK
jgi:hypothetical protein